MRILPNIWDGVSKMLRLTCVRRFWINLCLIWEDTDKKSSILRHFLREVFWYSMRIVILYAYNSINQWFLGSWVGRSRISPLEVFYRKGVLRNFAKFTGKHLWHSLLFKKVAGLSPATLLKKRLWHICFPVNFAKKFKNTFCYKHLLWLLLTFGAEGGESVWLS